MTTIENGDDAIGFELGGEEVERFAHDLADFFGVGGFPVKGDDRAIESDGLIC